jgi:hypothetical protein
MATASSLAWEDRCGGDDRLGQAIELTHPQRAVTSSPTLPETGAASCSPLQRQFDRAWRLNLKPAREQALTSAGAVNVEPHLSPDGNRIAWVSTAGTDHFNLSMADIGADGLSNAHR